MSLPGGVDGRPASDLLLREALHNYASDMRQLSAGVAALVERLRAQGGVTPPAPTYPAYYDPGDIAARQGGEWRPIGPGANPLLLDRFGRLRTYAPTSEWIGATILLTIVGGQTLGDWLPTQVLRRAGLIWAFDDNARAAAEVISFDVAMPSTSSAPDRLTTLTTANGPARQLAGAAGAFGATVGVSFSFNSSTTSLFPYIRARSAVAVGATRTFLLMGVE